MPIQHQMAVRVVFSNGGEAVALLGAVEEYQAMTLEAERAFARRGSPDFLSWRVCEPLVLNPPKALLEDLRRRGVCEAIYEADRAALEGRELHWPEVAVFSVGRYEGGVLEGNLDGVPFRSDPIVPGPVAEAVGFPN